MNDWGDIRSQDWRALEAAAAIPPRNRIYVNRKLRMASLGAIGFDLDHTLALYDPVPFENLAFEEAKSKLLVGGYPRSIADLRYRPGSMIRGLVVDKGRGNILKMDQHHYVALACHGSRPLPDDERKRLYQAHPVRLSSKRFLAIDTPFSLPEIDLFAQLVDMAEQDRWRPRDFEGLYGSVRAAMDLSHADGSIKEKIAGDPDRYLLIDPELPETLARMRAHGYRLFLLTNSEPAYTALIMERLLCRGRGSKACWTELFDWIVVRAGKPAFFRRRGEAIRAPIPRVTSRREKEKVVTGGGVADLEARLGCGGDRILYFGDHTYGDIMKSKRVRLWRTAMILRELEHEIEVAVREAPRRVIRDEGMARRDDLDLVRDYLDRMTLGEIAPRMPELGRVRARELATRLAQETSRIEEDLGEVDTQLQRAFNEGWGPLFHTGAELSHFAAQVRDFACIYTSRVSNFLHYPVDKYFQTHPERMPHEIEVAPSRPPRRRGAR